MKKVLTALLIFMLMVSLSLTGCGNNETADNANNPEQQPTANAGDNTAEATSEPENIDPFGKYEQTVTVTYGVNGNAATEFAPGDSHENNVWTRSLKEDLNIDAKVAWVAIGDRYETKLNLCIASNDLPDLISTINYTQFDRLVQGDKLVDLTDAYEKYTYPAIKQWIEEGAKESFEWGKVNGRLMGYSKSGINYQSTRMVHIRRDWFEATGLPKPQTMNDVIEIARAMKAQDSANRFGLTLGKRLIGEGMGDLVGIANSMGVYPRTWHEDSSGKLVYGSIQPGMKEVLQMYADFYQEGMIDPEFAVIEGTQIAEQLTTGKIGVVLGNFYLLNWPLNTLYQTDGVDWDSYPLPALASNTDKVRVQTDTPVGQFFCMQKGYKNPEVIFKILNYESSKVNDPATAETSKFHSDGKYNYHSLAPLYPIPGPVTVNFDTQKEVTEAIDKGDESVLKTPHSQSQYDTVKKYVDAVKAGTTPEPKQWSMYKYWYGPTSTIGIQNYYFEKDMYFTSKLVGYETEEMARRKLTLEQLEDTAFVEIIVGKKPIEYFDEFVTKWKNLGGEVIEYEVNEWYKSHK